VAQGFYGATLFGPTPVDEAFEMIERAGQLVGGNLESAAMTGTFRAALIAMQDRAEDARAEMGRAHDLWEEIGNPGSRITSFLAGGIMEQYLGDPERAEQSFRAGVALLDRLGETGYNSTVLAGLASALCDQGRFDEAETVARRSEEFTAEGDFASEAGWREARSLVLSSRDEHDAAISLADDALAFVEPTDYVEMLGSAHEVRGTVLAAAGRTDEARVAFEAALRQFEGKGIVPLIARMRERIAALAG
jgi:tetratricopeptide (TPR) repeat protein